MYTQKITSRDNENFKRWKSLFESRGIKKHNQFLASGEKVVRELILKSQNDWEWIGNDDLDAPSDFPGKSFSLSRELFRELDVFGTHNALLVGPCPEIKIWDYKSAEKDLTVGLRLICPLGDPSNLGAVLRSALALGCHSIILTQESANPYLPKSIRSSAGSVFNAPIYLGAELKEILNSQRENSQFFALDMDGQDLANFLWPPISYLVIGEEGPGLPAHHLKKLTIPIHPSVDSLNAVTATSLAIYSYKRPHS